MQLRMQLFDHTGSCRQRGSIFELGQPKVRSWKLQTRTQASRMCHAALEPAGRLCSAVDGLDMLPALWQLCLASGGIRLTNLDH